MRFLADGMLGKLTRWLRILGQNVKYSTEIDDSELVILAKKEHRILLTRDLNLFRQSASLGSRAFFIETDDHVQQLATLSARFSFPLKFSFALSRCPKCNTKLRSTKKEKVARKIQENTYNNYNEFWVCPNCHQIYWHGAHWRRIDATLKEAEEKLSSS